jgi:hypothetical protein
MELDQTKIVQHRLSNDQFFQDVHQKKQIYLHHTAGGGNPVSVAKFFQQKEGKVATAFVIGEKGTIVQLFSSKHWAYHLGLKPEVFAEKGIAYRSLDKISIGIEICNYGPLKKQNGNFINYVGGKVDRDAGYGVAAVIHDRDGDDRGAHAVGADMARMVRDLQRRRCSGQGIQHG